MTTSPDWRTAGLTDANGDVSQPVYQAPWDRPIAVVLKRDLWGDDWLVSASHGPRGEDLHALDRETTGGAGLLGAFLDLADAGPVDYLRFASRFGLLGLCHHGIPGTHHSLGLICIPIRTPLETIGAKGDIFWEPVSMWRTWVRAAVAILDIAAGLRAIRRRDGLTHTSNWQAVQAATLGLDRGTGFDRVTMTTGVFGEDAQKALTSLEGDRAAQRRALSRVLNAWSQFGRVRVQVEWDSAVPRLEQQSAGLFGQIVLELMAAVTSSGAWALCAGCGRWFTPSRRATTGKRRYCPKEKCQRAKRADASRDHRARPRKPAIAATGVPPPPEAR